MSQITAVDQDAVIFTTWRGTMKSPQLQGGSDQRIGSGTVIAYVSGSRAPVSNIEVNIIAIDKATANIAEKAIENLKQRICVVTDAHDDVFPLVLCHDAVVNQKNRGSAIGGKYLINATLQLEVLVDQIADNTILEGT